MVQVTPLSWVTLFFEFLFFSDKQEDHLDMDLLTKHENFTLGNYWMAQVWIYFSGIK